MTLAPSLRRLLLQGRAWAADYAYIVYWQVNGFFVRRDPAAYLTPPGSIRRSPVVLIPGVYENWQFLRPLAEHLFRRGHPVHTVAPLGYNRGRIEDMAALVSRYLAEQDLDEVLIIAHSKGGLIGKYLMTLPGGDRISRMVAVNTPFSGSVYANLFLLPSIRAFSPRNPFLLRLLENVEVNARITSVYSRFDPHVPVGSRLEGARNIRLDTMGHFRPVGDPRLLDVLDEVLGEVQEDGRDA